MNFTWNGPASEFIDHRQPYYNSNSVRIVLFWIKWLEYCILMQPHLARHSNMCWHTSLPHFMFNSVFVMNISKCHYDLLRFLECSIRKPMCCFCFDKLEWVVYIILRKPNGLVCIALILQPVKTYSYNKSIMLAMWQHKICLQSVTFS